MVGRNIDGGISDAPPARKFSDRGTASASLAAVSWAAGQPGFAQIIDFVQPYSALSVNRVRKAPVRRSIP
ncbi:hypothetical protein OSH11_16080 [Kaistia dalseonensis]|nr:hypothetical protein [Kaistia dalseonensis]